MANTQGKDANATKIGMVGAGGKMGRMIMSLTLDYPSIAVGYALDHSKSEVIGIDAGVLCGVGELGVKVSSDWDSAKNHVDAFIDFTSATAFASNIENYKKLQKPLVIGSTGLSDDSIKEINEMSKYFPIVFSPNMSIGVNITFKILEYAAKALNNMFDIEIVEAHHNKKKDAPSGTAMKMGEVVAEASGIDFKQNAVFCREGITGERKPNEIGMQTVRGGTIVGEHTVMFIGDDERIEITHRALNRQIFARGALLASKFVTKQKSGLFNMYDVLNI